jgi:ppGpp synthetase/RelA/SpoT-type nucleotidyltranferase
VSLVKRTIPKELLLEYAARQKDFSEALEWLVSRLRLRLSQLAGKEGTRAAISEWRIKRPGSIWRKARRDRVNEREAIDKTEDLLGLRITCNNLSDVESTIRMLKEEFPNPEPRVKDMIATPTKAGYRSVHVLSRLGRPEGFAESEIPFEIQVRTLSQDAWAKLSRADLYGRSVPTLIRGLAAALADQLAAIDKTAQLIRDELNKPVEAAAAIDNRDPVTPQRLATLYNELYGEDVYEYTLIDWVRTLADAEAETMGEVRTLLSDESLRGKLDATSRAIRRRDLEPSEWVIFSARIEAEGDRETGVATVKRQIRQQWEDLTSQARREVMPRTIEEFAKSLRNGSLDLERCLAVLDCYTSCARCDDSFFSGTEDAMEAILGYYGAEEDKWGIEELIEDAGLEEGNFDFPNLCSYCGYMSGKDD